MTQMTQMNRIFADFLSVLIIKIRVISIPLFLFSQYSILNTQYLFSQTILMEEDVNADTLPPTFGPNLKNFVHSYFRYGFVAGKSEGAGAEIIPGLSNEFSFGIRYKRKMNNFYALGFDVFYNKINYRLKQISSKVFPDTLHNHIAEKFFYNNFGLEIYNRFNFGKRGNILGNFLDLGGYGEWGFSIKHFFKDDLDTAQTGAKMREITNKKLLYANNLNYGATLRFGMNRFILYGKYRLSDIFKANYLAENKLKYPELPRLIVGLEIGLVK